MSHMPKTIVRSAAAAIMAVTLCATLLSVPAAAHHRPLEACSPSGDVCKSVRRVDGERRLRIALAAEYFERFRLCVTGPADEPTCHTYRVRDLGPVFGASILWRSNFPFEGPGAYTVAWKFTGGGRIGRALGFHVR